MKAILPRPLLWTEIKTMDEFLKGDFLTPMLYDIFKHIDEALYISHISAVTLFNELYYQLTRCNYEKPAAEDYLRYYNDIKTHLGYASHTNLVLTMMYHYNRLKDMHFHETQSPFMKTIKTNQMRKDFWRFFTRTTSTVFYWPEIVPYPQKPCPVAPNDLEKRGLEWQTITNQYDLESIKEVLDLWKNAEDKKDVANMIRKDMRENAMIPPYSRKYHDVFDYLKQVMNKVNGMPSSLESIVDSGRNGVTYRFSQLKKTDDYKEELKKKDEEILQLKFEKEDYKKRLALSEIKNRRLKQQHEEDEARIKSGFGSVIVDEWVNDKVVEHHVIDTDTNIALVESQRLNEMHQKQIEQMKKTSEKLEETIKELQEKLGKESVSLSVLAEGLKEYADEAGIDEAHKVFNHLNTLLISVPAWTKNVPELKKFFREARKVMEKGNVFENAQVTMQQPTINGPINEIHNNKKVNLGGD